MRLLIRLFASIAAVALVSCAHDSNPSGPSAPCTSGCTAPTTHTDFRLTFDSQRGDYIGQGRQFTLGPGDGTLQVYYPAQDVKPISAIEVHFTGRVSTNFWSLEFMGPNSTRISPGVYEHVLRIPFNSTAPGLSVGGDGRGCNELTGRFVVLEAVFGSKGDVQRLAIDYEQHCEGNAAALFGSVRISSTR